MEAAQDTNQTAQEQADTTSNGADGRAQRARGVVNGQTQRALSGLEHVLARGGDRLWRAVKQRPALGVSVATVLGLGLATAVGASELAFAFAAGIAAYHVLKNDEPPSKALEAASRFEL